MRSWNSSSNTFANAIKKKWLYFYRSFTLVNRVLISDWSKFYVRVFFRSLSHSLRFVSFFQHFDFSAEKRMWMANFGYRYSVVSMMKQEFRRKWVVLVINIANTCMSFLFRWFWTSMNENKKRRRQSKPNRPST